MSQQHSTPPFRLSADISAKRLSTLEPSSDPATAVVRDGRYFSQKQAKAITNWEAITELTIFPATSKAAVRELFKARKLTGLSILDLNQHGTLGEIPSGSVLNTFSCRSGLKARDLMSLTTLEKLTSLTLQDIALTMPFVSQLARNAQLSALNFEETNFSDEMAIELTNMPNLQKLVVGATKLTSKGLQTICSMNNLRELDIWAADIRDTDLAELTKLQNLKYLSLGGYEGQTKLSANELLNCLKQLPSLEQIWIDGIVLPKTDISQLNDTYEHVQVT